MTDSVRKEHMTWIFLSLQIANIDLLFGIHIVFWIRYFLCAETITRVNGTTVSPIHQPSLHDLQIYGIVVTIILCFIVFGGVKMINRVAPAFLIPVLFSMLCIFIGVFASGTDKPVGESATLLLFTSQFGNWRIIALWPKELWCTVRGHQGR